MSIIPDRVRQEADNISDSTVNQVLGNQTNIHGITVADAFEISRNVVKQELALLTATAIDVAEDRLKSIVEKTIDRTQTIDPKLLNRFGEPSIQFALNETYREYIKTGDVELGENLIDLLIDRLEVEDRTTMQFIIDEARDILPKLSKNTLSFLAFVVFSYITIPFIGRRSYEEYLAKLTPILSEVISVSVMDTMYLKQVGCATGVSVLHVNNPLETTLGNNYKLFFSYGCSQGTLNEFFSEYNSIISTNNIDTIRKVFGIIDSSDINDIRIGVPSEKNLSDVLQRNGISNTKPFFDSLLQSQRGYSDQEIIDFHIKINPNWNEVFGMWKRNDIASLQITSVGLYIGSKYLERITGMNKIPQEIFYKG